jgi:membrane protein
VRFYLSPELQRRLEPLRNFVGPIAQRYGSLNISLVSGGMAYYVMLALAPMAIAIGAIAGLFVDPQRVMRAWAALSADNSDSIRVFDPAVSALTDLAAKSSTGAVTIATVSSLILAIYVAQKVVYGVRNVEDQIFSRNRISLGLVMRGWSALIALLGIVTIVGSLLFLTIVPQFLQELGVATTVRSVLGYTQWLLPIVFVYLFVWIILARAARGTGKITWRSPGLVIATVWIVASVGVFGLYANLSSTVGSALVVFGAPIAILIWTFLVFMGFFIGSLVQAQIHAAAAADLPRPPTKY